MSAESVIEAHREAIASLCRKYAVRRLRVFGSATGEGWDPARSDFDFIVEFDRRQGLSAFDQLTGFKAEMEDLLGKEVDLVDWEAAKNPFFKRNAERQAIDVYAA